jgi:putative ABC transport system substrate-binding protein
MRRRDFMALLCGAAVIISPHTVSGQQRGRVPRVGVLMSLPESDSEAKRRIEVLQQGLQELGLRDGHNIHIEYRWGTASLDQTARNVKELIDLKPDVIVGVATPAVVALLRETRTIPIVFVQLADPVGQGMVESLAHPGGNATGFALFEFSMGGKWLELLKEIAPGVTRVAVIFNPDTAAFGPLYLHSVEAAAPSFSVKPIAAPVHDDTEVEGAMASLGREPGGGLIVVPDAFTTSHRKPIIELAAHHRLPAIYSLSFFAKDGGLLSYGVDILDLYRRAASYVDRILKGVRPVDLPVQQPTKFELIINVKSAKAIGLTVPSALVLRADEVIE